MQKRDAKKMQKKRCKIRDAKKDAKKKCKKINAKKRCKKRNAKKEMQKSDAKKMQKNQNKRLQNMQKEKPCNRKYASEKIQKWHKTDIKSSSQISWGLSWKSIKCTMSGQVSRSCEISVDLVRTQ